MMARCYNPKIFQFPWYGEEGVRVCERWHDFILFFIDMGPRPKGMTIERIDGKLDYHPSNCIWDTQANQSRNKRNNVWIEFNGTTMCLKDWSKVLGVKYCTLWMRLKSGFSIEKAFNYDKSQMQPMPHNPLTGRFQSTNYNPNQP